MTTTLVMTKQEAQEILKKIAGKFTVSIYRKSWLHDNISKNHDGATAFSGAYQALSVPKSVSSGLFVTGLSDEQSTAFEVTMNLKPGTLSPYNKEYWGDPKKWVKISKEGFKLDCDNIIPHKMMYLILKGQSENDGKVSMSISEAELNAYCYYVVTSDEVETRKTGENLLIKSQAFNRRYKMTDTEAKDFLKVYENGKFRTTEGTKKDLIDAKILEIVDKQPQKFLDIIEDNNFKDLVFLDNLSNAKLITSTGGRYQTIEGEPIGVSKTDAIANLRTPQFQDMRLALLSRLETINKK